MAVVPATKRAKREASIDALLSAALKQFVELGYQHTSVEAIGDAVGLTKGSVFFYFGTKANLMLALLDQVEDLVVDRVDNRIAAAGPSAEDKVLAFLRCQAQLGIEQREHVMLLILSSLEFRDAGDLIERRIKGIYARLYRLVEGVIMLGRRQGIFRTDISSREQAASVMANHDGTFLQWYRYESTLDGKELVRALSTTVLGGLRQPDTND